MATALDMQIAAVEAAIADGEIGPELSAVVKTLEWLRDNRDAVVLARKFLVPTVALIQETWPGAEVVDHDDD